MTPQSSKIRLSVPGYICENLWRRTSALFKSPLAWYDHCNPLDRSTDASNAYKQHPTCDIMYTLLEDRDLQKGGNLGNDDGDVNENGKKAIGLD